jgi:hypothetical protein
VLGTVRVSRVAQGVAARVLTVFFLAKSPEAPRTTMMVLSLSSLLLCDCRHQPIVPLEFGSVPSTSGKAPLHQLRRRHH